MPVLLHTGVISIKGFTRSKKNREAPGSRTFKIEKKTKSQRAGMPHAADIVPAHTGSKDKRDLKKRGR